MHSTNHTSFFALCRASQSPLCGERCQTILYKAVFEHNDQVQSIAALLLASKSFQNSSFGANFIVNFFIDRWTICLFQTVLPLSACFSLQFVPSIHIDRLQDEQNFLVELAATKYLPLQLRSLSMRSVSKVVFESFFRQPDALCWLNMRSLDLLASRVVDDDVALVAKSAPQLCCLSLFLCDLITDVATEHISTLASMIELDLSDCRNISDASLVHLSKLPNISTLRLWNVKLVTDVGLERISKLSRISSLNLGYMNKITELGFQHLTALEGMTDLSVSGCRDQISDACLEHISKLTGITCLDLSFCNIEDSGLDHVAKLPALVKLNLIGCGTISTEKLGQLKESCPKCDIRW